MNGNLNKTGCIQQYTAKERPPPLVTNRIIICRNKLYEARNSETGLTMDLIKKKRMYSVLICVLLTCITTTSSQNDCQATGNSEDNRIVDLEQSKAKDGVVAEIVKTTRVFGENLEDRLAACVSECCENDRCNVVTVPKQETENTETNCELTRCEPLDQCIWLEQPGRHSHRVARAAPSADQPTPEPAQQQASTVGSTTRAEPTTTLPPAVPSTSTTTANAPTEPAAPPTQPPPAPAGPAEGDEPTPTAPPSTPQVRSSTQPAASTISPAPTELPTPPAAKSTAQPTPVAEVLTPKATDTPTPLPPTEQRSTITPTHAPTPPPSTQQTTTLTPTPSPTPSPTPTPPPTQPPTQSPTPLPTTPPTETPTAPPTPPPSTQSPTPSPTQSPTPAKSTTVTTTLKPTEKPTPSPTLSPTPAPTEKATDPPEVPTEPPTPVPQPVPQKTDTPSTAPPVEQASESSQAQITGSNQQVTQGPEQPLSTPRNNTRKYTGGRINNEEIKNRSNTKAALIAALVFGTLFTISVLALVSKRFYESWQRRHYQKVDYLIEGLYNK